MAPQLRIALCDPFEISRIGITHALRPHGMSVEGSFDRPADAMPLVGRGGVDIVLVDVSCERFLESVAELAERGATVIATGVEADTAHVIQALRAGASGYLTKDLPARVWAEAIRAGGRGEIALSRMLTTRVVEAFRGHSPDLSVMEYAPSDRRLTKREWEVLAVLAEGTTNREIAQRLHISLETVRTHVSSILAKLEAPNRSAAAAKYRRLVAAQR
jgi:DNA-binding NarL/FixJ family response regulator